MCVYSMVVDHYTERWPRKLYPYEIEPRLGPSFPQQTPEEQQEQYKKIMEQLGRKFPQPEPISAEEINEFRDLLKRAREYDKKNNEPNCESETKIKKLMDVLDTLGVSEDVKKTVQNILNEE